MDVCAWPILWCSLCCTNTIGAAIRAPLKGEAQQIIKNPESNLLALRMCLALPICAAKAPCFAFKRREQRSTNNDSI